MFFTAIHYRRQWIKAAAVALALIPMHRSVYVSADVEPTGEQTPAASDGSAVRFEAVDIYIDSGTNPLAAYQIELNADNGQVKIAGVEGGEHAAFREPPFYDAAALQQNRIILAALSTAKELPQGKIRIARIHVQVQGDANPEYVTKLIVAASADGTAFPSELFVANAKGDSQ